MASTDDFRRVDLGRNTPNFQDNRYEPVGGGHVEHAFERFDTARGNDPTADIPATSWRPNQRPDELLSWQAEQVQQAVDAHLDMNASLGLTQPVAGQPGVHTWLRDERGYGNNEPQADAQTPFKK